MFKTDLIMADLMSSLISIGLVMKCRVQTSLSLEEPYIVIHDVQIHK